MNHEFNRSDLHSILHQFLEPGGPGLSALVGTDEGILVQEGYGLAHVDERVSITPDTRFVIASVTKQFTAAAVMLLKHRGYLDYDAPISQWFDNLPQWKQQITVRHLLTHTSGIPEYLSEQFFRNAEDNDPTLQQVLDMISDYELLNFSPGTDYSYSNSGYILLGELIRRIAETNFSDFIAENIFAPIGMNDSVVGTTDEMLQRQASGYRLCGEGFSQTPYNRSVVGWADGNIISSARDLFRWDRALYSEVILPQQEIREAFRPYSSNPDMTRYGFGFKVCDRRGLKEVWHAGGTLGYTSQFARYPQQKICIILLSNASGVELGEIRGQILNKLLPDSMELVQLLSSEKVTEEVLSRTEGSYIRTSPDRNRSGGQEEIEIRIEAQSVPSRLLISGGNIFKDGVYFFPVRKDLYRAGNYSDAYVRFLKSDGSPVENELSLIRKMRVEVGGTRQTFCKM